MSGLTLISGATGQVGSGVARALSAVGRPVRALVRDPERGRAILGDHAELAVGEFSDRRALEAALEDVERVLVVPPDRHVRLGEQLVTAAARAGVKHVVRISAIGADADSESELLRAHAAGETHLVASDVPHVNVRCNSFFQNLDWFGGWITEHGEYISCGGDAPVAWVDARDVADVATAVLLDGMPDGSVLEVTGGRPLTGPDVASAMAEALRRPVGYTDLTPTEFHARATKSGWNDWIAREWGAMYGGGFYGSGAAGVVTSTVSEWVGSQPREIEGYLEDFAKRLDGNRPPSWIQSREDADDS
jgi:uncharacterized protein YbjT (DUF2867 family)